MGGQILADDDAADNFRYVRADSIRGELAADLVNIIPIELRMHTLLKKTEY